MCLFLRQKIGGHFYDPPGRWKLNVSFSFSSHLLRRAWHILQLRTIVRPTKFVVHRLRSKFNDKVAKNSRSRSHKTRGNTFRFHLYREIVHSLWSVYWSQLSLNGDWVWSDPTLGNSGLSKCVKVVHMAVSAEGNGDLQILICVLVARPRRCLKLSNPVPWQNWMAAYLGYTLRMRTLFRGWPIMVNDTHTRRRRYGQLDST